MNPSRSALALKAVHSDLTTIYTANASKIEAIWTSLSKEERTKYFQNGATEDEESKRFLDMSLGITYDIVPELKLQDI
ncbi:hypothetical protein ACHAPE_010261 [Trichoderma viride]